MLGCLWRRVRVFSVLAFLLSGPSLAVDVTGTSVQLTWTAATGPVSGYAVQVSRSGGAYTEVARVAGRSVNVTGTIGQTVLVRVAAYNVLGQSGAFSPISDPIRFVAAPAPAPTIDLRADLDGNGRADALAVNASTGALAASLLQADGTRRWVTIGTPRDAAKRPVGFGDVDADGRADVLWRNAATGTNEIWLMRGLTYSVIPLPSQGPRYRVAAFRDFSGDGRADALFHDPANGQSMAWVLGASGFVTSLAVDPAPTGSRLVAVGDIDGDRSPDFVFRNTTTRRLDAWLLRGVVPRAVVTLGTAASGATVGGVGDFDGNGRDDLVWLRPTASGTVIDVWFLNGANAPSVGTALLLGAGQTSRGVADLASNGRDQLVVGGTTALYGVTVSPVRPSGAATRWTIRSVRLTGVPISSWRFLALE
ncbi:MAG TPA: FG-GAP-like repeat-containing protein [Myxococcota bacterium]|nr:FG-GAP-like repeat-containing protein [Myxococcota bacterium]